MMTRKAMHQSARAAAMLFILNCAPRTPSAPGPSPLPEPARAAAPAVERAPLPEMNPGLPPVPLVTGPLEIRVVYPTAGSTIQSRDSNFVFGSVGNGTAGLRVNGVLTPVWPNGAFMAWLPVPPADSPRYEIVATTGRDTARLTHPVKVLPPVMPPPPGAPVADTVLPGPRWATLVGPPAAVSDTDRVVTGYGLTTSAHRWFLLPGTRVRVVGHRGNNLLVELDSSQRIYVERPELRFDSIPHAGSAVQSPASAAVLNRTSTASASRAVPPLRRAGAVRVVPSQAWVDVSIPVSGVPPHLVEQAGRTLTLTLYGTAPHSSRTITPPAGEPYLGPIATAATGQQTRYTIGLNGPVVGYQVLWQDSTFLLRIRRPPQIDPANPLRGLTIAVDPGHPPLGATGPTGLREADFTLPVGLKVRDMLVQKGANVLMTRSTPDAVELGLRPAMARRASAHALVSIHFNALPDGQNPFTNHGTSTYYFHEHSRPFAEIMQRHLVREMSLRDLGAFKRNLALVRPTWMPAVLAEGAFMMMPDQEAAIATPEYQERYARGLVAALEEYFRSLAQAQH